MKRQTESFDGQGTRRSHSQIRLLTALLMAASVLAFGVPNTAIGQEAISADEVLPTIRYQDAQKYMGQEVFVVGRVESVGQSNAGHRFLNFGTRGTPEHLAGFIHADVAATFTSDPKSDYEGKDVKVRGELYVYRDTPNIRITTPKHISLATPDDLRAPERTAARPSATQPAATPRRANKETITVASYNILNLFDDDDDPYHSDEGTKAKPRAELELVATSLRQLDADVVALVEIENRGYLERFNQAMLADLGYTNVVHFEGNDRRGIDVALLSRIPVGAVTSHRHVRFPNAEGEMMRFRRDLLQVRIEPTGGEPFDVFVIHFKSKGGSENGSEEIRLPEAQATRAILDAALVANPNHSFVICGDFNDELESRSLQAIIGSGSAALTTFIDDLPADGRVTYNREPFLSMIDFILASPAMAKRYVQGSYRILPGSPETTGSDHNAVVAEFRRK